MGGACNCCHACLQTHNSAARTTSWQACKAFQAPPANAMHFTTLRMLLSLLLLVLCEMQHNMCTSLASHYSEHVSRPSQWSHTGGTRGEYEADLAWHGR